MLVLKSLSRLKTRPKGLLDPKVKGDRVGVVYLYRNIDVGVTVV